MRISDWSSDVCSSDLEYYQLSLEKTLLAIAGHDLQSFSIDTICELGAGSALKASMLIKAMNASGRTLRYCPIDVNERVLRAAGAELAARSEEHTSELQSLMRISYAVFCLKKKHKQ